MSVQVIGPGIGPFQWNLQPDLTELPWLWQKYNPIVYPFWQGAGSQNSAEPLALNGRLGLLDAGASWASTPFGRGVYTDGTTDGNVHLDTWDGAGKVTLIWFGRFRTTASAIEQITAADSSNSGFRTFQFRRSATGTIQFIPFVSNSPVTIESTTTVGTAPICVVARNDGTNGSVFVGKPTAEDTTATGSMDTDASSWTLGGRAATFVNIGSALAVSESGNIETGLLIRVDDALSDNEIAQIILDPFAAIRPSYRRVFPVAFVPAGGATTLTAASGSYTITGNAATLTRSHIMAAEAGSYAITGNAASLLRDYVMPAVAGSYAYTGNAATLTSSSGFSPLSISGCVRWYDAQDSATITLNGSDVEQWDDKSASADHATQATAGSRPSVGTLNGFDAIDFDGVDEFLSMPDFDGVTGSQNHTIFLVYLHDDFTADQFVFSYGGAADGQGIQIGTYDSDPSVHVDSFTQTFESSFDLTAGEGVILSVKLDGTQFGDFTVYRGGSSDSPVNTTSMAISASGISAIGRYLNFSGTYFDGRVGEVVVYDSALSDADRGDVVSYLGAKWGLGGIILAATSGSYVLTGSDAGTAWDHVLPAVAGSYSLTGQNAATLRGYTLLAASGAYVLTGNASGTLWDHSLAATQGVYSLTGNDINTLSGLSLTAVAGSYAITGNAAATSRGYVLAALSGAYEITGNAALFEAPIWQNLPANPGETWTDSSSGSSESWYSATPGPGETWSEE